MIVNAIKDALLRFQFQLESCREQSYDGANNLVSKKSGAATRIRVTKSTHCALLR